METQIPEPAISVIMPVHNCADFVVAQLDALLGNAALDIEVIAVDDGSRDDSLAILHAYRRRDARLQVIEQPAQGPGAARNTGLRAARAAWIAFADADDVMPGNSLKTWLDQAIAQNLDVLIGNGFRFRDDPAAQPRVPILTHQPHEAVMSGEDWIVHCLRTGQWPHYVWLQLISRALIDRHRLSFHPTILHEDILWTADLALAAQRIGFAPAPVYGYRRHPDSVVSSRSPEQCARRGSSYIFVIAKLLSDAQQTRLAPRTRTALRRQAAREAGYFVDLLRKDIQDPQMRRLLARQFMALRARPALWASARRLRELTQIMKIYRRLRRMARAGGRALER